MSEAQKQEIIVTGTPDKRTFKHTIDCPIDDAWAVLFTQEYDDYYMKKFNLGKCQQIQLSQEQGKITKDVKVNVNLGYIASYTFVPVVKKYYQTDEMCYKSHIEKITEKNGNNCYTMTFENKNDFVASLECRGQIVLQEHPEDKNKCIMTTTAYFLTFFEYPGLHTLFMGIINTTTKDVFGKMVSVLPEYMSK